MAQIRPFKAVRYNGDKIMDLSFVVAPPYDVIPKDMQSRLYKTHPHNIVRLILGKVKKKDNLKNNRYTRARKFFEAWLKEDVLIQDEKDALYIYSQDYTYDNKKITRIGFISLMALGLGENDNKVLPHENTLSAPKMDRMRLMKEVRANLSPIFVLYDDTSHKVFNILKHFCSNNKPIADIRFEGVRQRLWRLDDARAIEKIERLMRRKDIFIADGHHRYEVARMYARYAQNSPLPREPKENSKYMMAYFVGSDEEMLTILPTHRIVKSSALKKKAVEEHLNRFFYLDKVSGLKSLLSRLSSLIGSQAFGMYLGGNSFYLLRLKSAGYSDRVMGEKPGAWKRLDVSILHLFIFRHALGLRDDDDNIEFVKNPQEAVKSVDSGKFKMAFFLNPTKVSQVKRIAKLGERMPRKATYFYPKPLSGLVINKL